MEPDNGTRDSLPDSLRGLNLEVSSPPSARSGRSPAWGDNGNNVQSLPHGSQQVSTSNLISQSPAPSATSSTSRPRPLQQRLAPPSVHEPTSTDHTFATGQFEPPHRSIFASGPPTSSISVNTAQASLSTATPSSSSRPLAALTNAGLVRRGPVRSTDLTNAITLLPSEKDVDDFSVGPSTNSLDPYAPSTSQKLSTLFSMSEITSPGPLSRQVTHSRSLSTNGKSSNDATTLGGHLLHVGFFGARHSDVTIRAFGESYRLHKLILDRAPFFSHAFGGPWSESSSNEMKLAPQEIDSNITRTSFELALKRLYGTVNTAQEEQEAIGLFATACWLDMPELVDACVGYILRQMQPSKLQIYIRLVTNNYYGKAGDRILSSARAMLCREGWEMPYQYWDEIPAEIVREIIGGDPFYVPGEWERWFLTLKLLNRRLKKLAIQAGLVSSDGFYLFPRPQSLRFFSVRFDTTYRRDTGVGSQQHWSEQDDAWCPLYTSSEVAPLLVLLDEGIHYVHLRFEQLQLIRLSKDILGVPVLPEKVISDALWMSMELRQRILNAHETDLELGISEVAESYTPDDDELSHQQSEAVRGKQREDVSSKGISEMESGSWDGNGHPRKFWIPTTDVSCIMGGAREALPVANATNSGDWSAAATRLSASLEPSDVGWASDFVGNFFEGGSASRNLVNSSPPRYSHYPPFRFSVDFPNPRTLKEKKRVYSQTVWYAGSMWNLYIQRVNTSKNQQLGIYLHRAKDKDPSDDPLAQFIPTTVDDQRTGNSERDMILRRTDRDSRSWRADTLGESGGGGSGGNNTSEHEPDEYDTHPDLDPSDENSGFASGRPRPSNTVRHSHSHSHGRLEDEDIAHKSSQTPMITLRSPDRKRTIRLSNHSPSPLASAFNNNNNNNASFLDSDDEDVGLNVTYQKYASGISNSTVATMPPYTDGRSTIKTYFKIYSPSKGGRLLSVYESAPDSFNFGKSWGWKSSQMVLDDGLGGPDTGGAKDGRLRYMVVIGNV